MGSRDVECVVDEGELGEVFVLNEVTRSSLSLTAIFFLGTDDTDSERSVVAV